MMYFQCCPDQYSYPTSANVADAIYRARVLGGAKVISMSLSRLPNLDALNTQITYAKNAGVVICVSSGNYLRYLDEKTNQWVYEKATVTYPATNTDVISVGATIENDYRKEWDMNNLVWDWGSCYEGHLDIVAPGINIPTTDLFGYQGNYYATDFLGTSAAAPHIAGVIALIFSLQPNFNVTPDQIVNTVKSILSASADFETFMNQYEYGAGRLNAYKALKYTIEHYGGTFNQNVTIPSGDTWDLQSGVTLTFASGASLIVNGILNANNVTFTRSGSSGTWGGIQFNSGSSGNLQYCNVSNATTGIYLYNSSPQISHCTIQNGGYGVYCDYYSSPTMSNNLIQSNSYGIWCNSGSSPNLSTLSVSGNVIRNNTYDGLYAIYGSNPTLGVNNLGGNSIYSNGIPTVRAIYSSNINAINNWWGIYPPSSSLFYTYYGTIAYMPALSSNPNYSVVVNNDNPATGTTLNVNYSVVEDDLGSALDKQKDKKYDEAIPLFLQVFKNNTDALIGKYALSKIEECFTQAGKKDYLDYSKKEIKPLLKNGSETYVQSLELETHQMINAGTYKDAVDNLLTILKKYNLNNYIEKNTLFRLGAFYSQFLDDAKSSDKYFDELKQKYPDDELVNQIETIKSLGVVSNGLVQIAELMPAEETVAAGRENSNVTISNYPNPFNPTTKISFSLPQKSQVKLRVFDVLGREIQILANGVYEAGKYEVEFNANSLSSGVYFYNLSDGTNSITKKMLLMK